MSNDHFLASRRQYAPEPPSYGVAKQEANSQNSVENQPAAMATPEASGDAMPSIQESINSTLPDLLPDLSNYDITIEQAEEMIRLAGRKPLKERSLQRYCQEGGLDCFKLQTSRDGKPRAEWLVNSSSLRAFIEKRAPDENPPSPAVTVATPEADGDAKFDIEYPRNAVKQGDVMASPKVSGVATGGAETNENVEEQRDAMATPEANGVAKKIYGDRGEVELLIENARLVASLEAQREATEVAVADKERFARMVDTLMQNSNDAFDKLTTMFGQSAAALAETAKAGTKTETVVETKQGAVPAASYTVPPQPPQPGPGSTADHR